MGFRRRLPTGFDQFFTTKVVGTTFGVRLLHRG
jgi:hypothetical protein